MVQHVGQLRLSATRELPVKDIDVGLIVKVLMPIWHEKPETARRVRMRIETIFEWAIL
jgi:hypothetical protein